MRAVGEVRVLFVLWISWLEEGASERLGGARRLGFEEIRELLTVMATTKPTAHGGTVSNWAWTDS